MVLTNQPSNFALRILVGEMSPAFGTAERGAKACRTKVAGSITWVRDDDRLSLPLLAWASQELPLARPGPDEKKAVDGGRPGAEMAHR